MKDIYDFLTDLRKNNNRAWFDNNRDRYKETKEQFEVLTQEIIMMLSKYNPEYASLNPKDCIFRIFRDVRFSHDKSPYKPNYAAFIALGGKKGQAPGYYFHFEPGNCTLGGGVFRPEKDELKIIRERIYASPDDFMNIIEKPSFRKVFPKLFDEGKLKMGPKGFPKDFEHIDLLKYKSYIVSTYLTDEQLLSADLMSTLEKRFKVLKPFNEFLK